MREVLTLGGVESSGPTLPECSFFPDEDPVFGADELAEQREDGVAGTSPDLAPVALEEAAAGLTRIPVAAANGAVVTSAA